MVKPKQARLPEDNDGDETEKSTVASSDDSFFAEFALRVFQQSIMGRLRTSTKKLAQKSTAKLSAAKLSPLLQSGPSHFRRRAAPNQKRKRQRRDFAAKMQYRFQRLNQDPLVTSRAVLALVSICLIIVAGNRLLAAWWSFMAVMILQETTKYASTGALSRWYFVSLASLAVSIGSWALSTIAGSVELDKTHWWTLLWSDRFWIWSQLVPRFLGVLLAYLLHQDAVSNNDDDDEVIDTWRIQVSLVQVKRVKLPYTASLTPTTKIQVQHGSVHMGTTDTTQLLVQSKNVAMKEPERAISRYYHTTVSHFIEARPYVECQLLSSVNASSSIGGVATRKDASILGMANIPIPLTHNVKMTSWYTIQSNEKDCPNLGELLVEIQTQPAPQQFLFRPASVLSLIGFVVSILFWR